MEEKLAFTHFVHDARLVTKMCSPICLDELLSNKCSHDAQWLVFKCSPNYSPNFFSEWNCGPPPGVSDTVATFSSTEYLSETVYTCRQGHAFANGSLTLTSICSEFGTWTTISTPCESKLNSLDMYALYVISCFYFLSALLHLLWDTMPWPVSRRVDFGSFIRQLRQLLMRLANQIVVEMDRNCHDWCLSVWFHVFPIFSGHLQSRTLHPQCCPVRLQSWLWSDCHLSVQVWILVPRSDQRESSFLHRIRSLEWHNQWMHWWEANHFAAFLTGIHAWKMHTEYIYLG